MSDLAIFGKANLIARRIGVGRTINVLLRNVFTTIWNLHVVVANVPGFRTER